MALISWKMRASIGSMISSWLFITVCSLSSFHLGSIAHTIPIHSTRLFSSKLMSMLCKIVKIFPEEFSKIKFYKFSFHSTAVVRQHNRQNVISRPETWMENFNFSNISSVSSELLTEGKEFSILSLFLQRMHFLFTSSEPHVLMKGLLGRRSKKERISPSEWFSGGPELDTQELWNTGLWIMNVWCWTARISPQDLRPTTTSTVSRWSLTRDIVLNFSVSLPLLCLRPVQ